MCVFENSATFRMLNRIPYLQRLGKQKYVFNAKMSLKLVPSSLISHKALLDLRILQGLVTEWELCSGLRSGTSERECWITEYSVSSNPDAGAFSHCC